MVLFLYKKVRQAVRYSLNLPISTLVMGMNRLDHLEININTINEYEPFEFMEYDDLFRTAPELNTHVCRLCGKCRTDDFDPEVYFLLEGLFDRQIESCRPEVNPAEFALKERLKHLSGQADTAAEEYQKLDALSHGQDYSSLNTLCPYSINIDRKLKIVHSKLSGSKYIFWLFFSSALTYLLIHM